MWHGSRTVVLSWFGRGVPCFLKDHALVRSACESEHVFDRRVDRLSSLSMSSSRDIHKFLLKDIVELLVARSPENVQDRFAEILRNVISGIGGGGNKCFVSGANDVNRLVDVFTFDRRDIEFLDLIEEIFDGCFRTILDLRKDKM